MHKRLTKYLLPYPDLFSLPSPPHTSQARPHSAKDLEEAEDKERVLEQRYLKLAEGHTSPRAEKGFALFSSLLLPSSS